MSKTRREIESLVEALDEVPDEEEAAEAVAALGVDMKSFGAKLRAQVAEAAARERKARFERARAEARAEAERLAGRRLDLQLSRDEKLALFRSLVSRAPAHAVAMHFHKYESASDEELAELIRSLRHLLGEDEDGG